MTTEPFPTKSGSSNDALVPERTSKQDMALRKHTFAAARTPAQMEKIVLSIVRNYLLDQLLDSERRAQHKNLCSETLVQKSVSEDGYANYAEQAVLANLDWGIEALEEAIRTPHEETKSARLEHAEKMLQVCALLDTRSEIVGIPSAYLSAWGSLILSYVWKLRGDDRKAAVCLLDMFLADPRSGRVKFAPRLWEQLFQPHLTSIKGWYRLQRHRVRMLESEDDVSFSFQSREDVSGEDAVLSLEQMEKLEEIEGLYQDSLDDHTRQFAQYYKEWLTLTADNLGRPISRLMPIAEPPMTPVHELAAFHHKSVLQQSFGTSGDTPVDNLEKEEAENIKSNTDQQGLTNREENEETDTLAFAPTSPLEPMISTPPKDFVCPITNQIFEDPVTLETGQTYERKAIREWLSRGNITCPMTRQTLNKVALPRTNYILRRLIADWKQASAAPSSASSLGTVFPTNDDSSLTTNTAETMGIEQLKKSLAIISRLDDIPECEAAVRTIAQIWQEENGDKGVETLLTDKRVINGLMETIFKSKVVEVRKKAVHILTGLVQRHELARKTVFSIDPGLQRMQELLKEGLVDLAVLLLPLRSDISTADLLPYLVAAIQQNTESTISDVLLKTGMKPKTAAITMLDHILSSTEFEKLSLKLNSLIPLAVLPALVNSLNAKDKTETNSAVSILLRCVHGSEEARSFVSQAGHLTSLLEILHSNDRTARTRTVALLAGLVRSHKKSSNIRILELIRNDGRASSMHTLLVHLQVAPLEQRALTAGLLMQLDLLEEPRSTSIYKEEAMEVLLNALQDKDQLSLQVEAACTLMAVIGRFSSSGEPELNSWLEKISKTKPDNEDLPTKWDKNVAKTLLDYEHGIILDVLAEHLLADVLDLAMPCITIATWLLCMATEMPDTGLWNRARRVLLPPFISLLKFDAHRFLASLSLYSFLQDPGSVKELLKSASAVCKPIKSLKDQSWTASKLYKAFITSPAVKADMWKHKEVQQIDASSNGEVRALACANGFLYSGHSDGTIKSWRVVENHLFLAQEAADHSKCVTSLAILTAKKRLYSGSLDKTIRVWSTEGSLRCLHIFELNSSILGLVVTGSIACIILQGSPGIQVQYEETETRTVSTNKNVQSLAVSKDTIYCGCTDNSVQETDPTGSAMMCIQGGVRTLLGKKPVFALRVFQGQIYAAGASVDGMTVKVWNQTDKSLVGALSMQSEVRSMTMNAEFLYFGLSSGNIEVWLRARLVRVEILAAGSKINAMALDGDVLYSGSGDGKIKVWTCL